MRRVYLPHHVEEEARSAREFPVRERELEQMRVVVEPAFAPSWEDTHRIYSENEPQENRY